jgi:hypothetical protein
MMPAVATSPDDLFFSDCRSGRYGKRLERLSQRKEKTLPFIVLV